MIQTLSHRPDQAVAEIAGPSVGGHSFRQALCLLPISFQRPPVVDRLEWLQEGPGQDHLSLVADPAEELKQHGRNGRVGLLDLDELPRPSINLGLIEFSQRSCRSATTPVCDQDGGVKNVVAHGRIPSSDPLRRLEL